jgi:hypothetical protein
MSREGFATFETFPVLLNLIARPSISIYKEDRGWQTASAAGLKWQIA